MRRRLPRTGGKRRQGLCSRPIRTPTASRGSMLAVQARKRLGLRRRNAVESPLSEAPSGWSWPSALFATPAKAVSAQAPSPHSKTLAREAKCGEDSPCLYRRSPAIGIAWFVAQTSKSAVSRVSKLAGRSTLPTPPIWKSATRQVWKPALRENLQNDWSVSFVGCGWRGIDGLVGFWRFALGGQRFV